MMLWIVGSGFTVVCALIGIIWHLLMKRIDEIASRFIEVTEKHREFMTKCETLSEKLGEVAIKLNNTTQAVLAEKVRTLERNYELMHTWKNVMLPEQLARLCENNLNLFKQMEGELKHRMAQLERK